jgi:hypothetical protein
MTLMSYPEFQRIEALWSRYAADCFRYAADGYSTHGYSAGGDY